MIDSSRGLCENGELKSCLLLPMMDFQKWQQCHYSPADLWTAIAVLIWPLSLHDLGKLLGSVSWQLLMMFCAGEGSHSRQLSSQLSGPENFSHLKGKEHYGVLSIHT
jgi:hypothetical protein